MFHWGDEHGRRFRIGEVAALSGVTPRALRSYEARGLLGSPERTESGYRAYGAAELVQAVRIRRLRALGMSLEQIAGIVADDADPRVLPDQLLSKVGAASRPSYFCVRVSRTSFLILLRRSGRRSACQLGPMLSIVCIIDERTVMS